MALLNLYIVMLYNYDFAKYLKTSIVGISIDNGDNINQVIKLEQNVNWRFFMYHLRDHPRTSVSVQFRDELSYQNIQNIGKCI